MSWHGMAWQGRAGHGRAGQGRAVGRAGRGGAGQGVCLCNPKLGLDPSPWPLPDCCLRPLAYQSCSLCLGFLAVQIRAAPVR